MSNEIVLDIETQNSFSQAREKNRGRLLISLVGIYRYDADKYETYSEKELNKLWPLLEHADRIIGFNLDGFDFPILDNYYPGQMKSFNSLDIMTELEKKLGFRVSLDSVAKGTLGTEKTSDGLQAIRLWREGKIDELKDYCLHDVKLTKEVYEYGKKNGFIKYSSKFDDGQAAIDFSLPAERNRVNLTLPI